TDKQISFFESLKPDPRLKIVKHLTLSLLTFSACLGLAYAGTEYSGKKMKQVAPPCPQWYADNEWNISLWGTYAATGTEFAPNLALFDIVQSTTEGHTVYGTFDRYLGGDHAFGGGIDLKYFFHRYFGTGEVPLALYHAVHRGTTPEPVGRCGGGLEFRITAHIGSTNDFSWNVINGPHTDIGMVRTGLTFPF